jgi:type I restriction enzyme, S subunit
MENLKNVPILRFPEFNEEWELKKLGDIMEFKNGINASKEQYGKGIKFINVLDILNNAYICYDNIIGSVDVDAETIKKFSVTYGDLLFQRSSETREEVGTANVYLDKFKPATFGGFVIRGKKVGDYDPIFLNELLKTDSSRSDITSKSGGSTRYNVGQETLSAVKLTLPILPEQQKIASFFTAIDQKISQVKQKKNLLERYKKGVLRKIFLQEIRFKDNNGQEFPSWEKKRLGECLDYIQPSKYIVSSTDYDDTYLTPVLTAGTSFILGYTNETKGIFNEPLPVIIFDDFTTATQFVNFPFKVKSSALKILVASKNSNIKFIFEAMQCINYEIGGHERHWISKYSLLYIDLPVLSEQTKIANFLSAIDDKINHTQKQIEKAEVWKKGLLQQMFM